MRSYSLCGDPDDLTQYRVAVLRVHDGRGGSQELHRVVDETRRSLAVSAPRNDFELVDAPAYLFVAGGIGITPLLPMVRAASAAGIPWTLVYGGRTRDTMAFLPELADAPGGVLRVLPQDEAGLIPISELFDALADGVEVYACGPAPLLDACQEAAARRETSLHLERFFASRAMVPTEQNHGFDVELRRTGTELHIASNESILARVREVLPGQPWSCEEGVCGSCETTVLDGEIDHRDEILDEDERAANDTMFICVSRCLGARLVLDL